VFPRREKCLWHAVRWLVNTPTGAEFKKTSTTQDPWSLDDGRVESTPWTWEKDSLIAAYTGESRQGIRCFVLFKGHRTKRNCLSLSIPSSVANGYVIGRIEQRGQYPESARLEKRGLRRWWLDPSPPLFFREAPCVAETRKDFKVSLTFSSSSESHRQWMARNRTAGNWRGWRGSGPASSREWRQERWLLPLLSLLAGAAARQHSVFEPRAAVEKSLCW